MYQDLEEVHSRRQTRVGARKKDANPIPDPGGIAMRELARRNQSKPTIVTAPPHAKTVIPDVPEKKANQYIVQPVVIPVGLSPLGIPERKDNPYIADAAKQKQKKKKNAVATEEERKKKRRTNKMDSVTRTNGKPVYRPEESDLYAVNPAPRQSVLNGLGKAQFVDEEGREYWEANGSGGGNWNNEWIVRLYQSPEVNPGDRVYWVRLPGKSSVHEMGPVVPRPGDTIEGLGRVIHSGSDAPRTYASRKTSYVLVR